MMQSAKSDGLPVKYQNNLERIFQEILLNRQWHRLLKYRTEQIISERNVEQIHSTILHEDNTNVNLVRNRPMICKERLLHEYFELYIV